MIRTKLFLGCALAFAISLAVGTTTYAQEPIDQRTYFMFSAAFELPGGKTLPAGRYMFRIVDSPSNRHVVQIMSQDGKQIHATLLAIPAPRQDPPNDPEVRFMETAANMPPAIRTWWYPGRTIGHEFIYPREHARRLARRQTESVLTVAGDANTAEAMRTADLARINASGQEAAVRGETTTAEARATQQQPRSAPAQTATAERTPTPPRTVQATQAARTRTELPRTATMLPLIGLIGVMSLAGAAALWLRRSR